MNKLVVGYRSKMYQGLCLYSQSNQATEKGAQHQLEKAGILCHLVVNPCRINRHMESKLTIHFITIVFTIETRLYRIAIKVSNARAPPALSPANMMRSGEVCFKAS